MNDAPITSPMKQENDIQAALKDIRTSLQKNKPSYTDNITPSFVVHASSTLANNLNNYYDNSSAIQKEESPTTSLSPVWIPRCFIVYLNFWYCGTFLFLLLDLVIKMYLLLLLMRLVPYCQNKK